MTLRSRSVETERLDTIEGVPRLPQVRLARGEGQIEPAYRPSFYIRGTARRAEEKAREIIAEAERVLADTRAERAAQVRAALKASERQLEEIIQGLEAEYRRMRERYESDVVATSAAMISALLDVDDHLYGDALASMAGAALASFKHERSITVHAAPASAKWLEMIRQEMALPRDQSARIDIVADAGIAKGTLCIDSEHGRRRFSLRSRLRRIRTAARRQGNIHQPGDSSAADALRISIADQSEASR